MANKITGGSIIWNLDIDSKKFDEAISKSNKDIESLTKKGSSNFKDFEKNSTKSVNNVSTSLKDLSNKIGDVGNKMTLRFTVPIVAGFALASKSAIDYESAFAGIRKTVDASDAEFKQLSTNIRDIAKASPVSAVELAGIGEIAGQLGVRGVDDLTKFIDTVSKIGVTTNLTGEIAASTFARISNVMQEPLSNVDRMASAIVDLGNNFATTESEIAGFAERIAGAGKIAGLTTADVLGIGAAMSSVGIEAEAGGTAVQKVLIQMTEAASGSSKTIIDNTKKITENSAKLADLKDKLKVAKLQMSEFTDGTKKSTKAIKEQQIKNYTSEIDQLEGTLGALNSTNGKAAVSASDFAKVLGVTNSEFQTMFKQEPSKVFTQFVEKLGTAGDKAFGILENLDLTDQRLIRGFLSLANAGDLLTNAIDRSSKAWGENTALTNEAQKRFETTESQIGILKNGLIDIGVSLGATLLPAINDVVEAITPMINKISDFAEANPDLIKISLGFLGILAVAGPLITIVSGLIALFSSPAFLTVVGVVTAIAAAFALLIRPVTDLWNRVGGLEGIMSKLQPVIDLVSRALRYLGDIYTIYIRPFIELLGATITNELIPALKELWGTIKDDLLPEFQKLWDILSPILVPVLKLLGTLLLGVVVVAVDALILVLTVATKALTVAVKAIDFMIQIFISLSKTLGTVLDLIGIFASYVVSRFTSMKNSTASTIEQMKNRIIELISSLPNGVKNALSTLASTLAGPFQDAWNKIKPILDKIKSGLDKINPFHRNSPSLVDNVKAGVQVIKDQYISLRDISLPPVVQEIGTVGSANLAGLDVGGGGSKFNQNINIEIGSIRDQQDIDALGREFGYRANLAGVRI